jgi:hypothetical protein
MRYVIGTRYSLDGKLAALHEHQLIKFSSSEDFPAQPASELGEDSPPEPATTMSCQHSATYRRHISEVSLPKISKNISALAAKSLSMSKAIDESRSTYPIIVMSISVALHHNASSQHTSHRAAPHGLLTSATERRSASCLGRWHWTYQKSRSSQSYSRLKRPAIAGGGGAEVGVGKVLARSGRCRTCPVV